MHFLLHFPTFIALFIVSALSVLLALTTLFLVRKKYPPEQLKENHEVAAIIFGAFGWLYAVIVAFVVFVTWTGYSDASKNMQLEASEALDIFHAADVFTAPLADQIRSEIIAYVESVRSAELPRMTSENMALYSMPSLHRLNQLFNTAPASGINNREVYAASLQQLDDLTQYRRLRIFAGTDNVPPLVWMVLLAGGFIMVANTFFFAMKHLGVQAIMTAILTIMLALVLFLIFVLDHPFAGRNRVSDAPLGQALAIMKQRQAAGSATR
jgi:uncharacterized membrane protein